MSEPAAVGFTGLVDLAAAALGGRALGASDDFFAAAENLIQPGRGVFIDGQVHRSRQVDGRLGEPPPSRAAPGPDGDCDWCVLELGAPGQVLGFDIDTNHFLGNHPPFASIDGVAAPPGTPLAELAARADWVELLAQSPLRPGSQNLFAAIARAPVSHVRLKIFPDGGVARLRVFGRVAPLWQPARAAADADAAAHVAPDAVDLAAVRNGGLALACSDAFFGPMNNLLLPGRAANMGGGWETRRRRGPGHDWILIKLGAPGIVDVVEVDTNHFKGNYPDRCSLEAIARARRAHHRSHREPGVGAARARDQAARARAALLRDQRRGAHGRPATHLRLNIFPDGGVSRLRAWGRRHG